MMLLATHTTTHTTCDQRQRNHKYTFKKGNKFQPKIEVKMLARGPHHALVQKPNRHWCKDFTS